MRVVAYVRVSTDAQAERGHGLAVQETAVRDWAKEHGHRLVLVARDEGVSGGNHLSARLGLLAGLRALSDHRAEGLVVYRLDRLARDLIVQEQLLAEVRRLGARVYSTAASEDAYLADDPGDPSRKLIRQVLGAVSEYERAMITLRMQAGRVRKAELGGYAAGRPPFGFRAQNGELVTARHEQRVIARMRELEATGLLRREIAERLNTEGHRTKRGCAWSRVGVGIVLRRAPVEA